jgi:hypothetical protein
MTTSFAPSSRSLLWSCLAAAASAERVSLANRQLPSTTEKGVTEMKQSQSSLNIQLQYSSSDTFMIASGGSSGRESLSPPLAAFPLRIAYSYQTMEQEYDRDTWRMYKRIQSARARQQQRISFIEDTVLHSVNSNNDIDVYYDDDDRPFTEVHDESEGIFEFDF